MAESFCQGCTLTFSGLTAFDRHQRTTRTPPHIQCLDPRDVGLVAQVRMSGGRRRTVWGFPKPDRDVWGDASGCA